MLKSLVLVVGVLAASNVLAEEEAKISEEISGEHESSGVYALALVGIAGLAYNL